MAGTNGTLRRCLGVTTLAVLLVVLIGVSGTAPSRAATRIPDRGLLWAARYDDPDQERDDALDVGASPDGGAVFVTGSIVTSQSGIDWATLAYDGATGARRWIARYAGPGLGADEPAGLAVSRDGATVFVCGYTIVRGDTAFITVAYDAETGAERWLVRYDGPGNLFSSAEALAVSPDGATVFVTGYIGGDSATSNDYVTFAYDVTTGTREWMARYNGPLSAADLATAIGVSPDGARVFVTGWSTSAFEFDYDYATVAYDAATGNQQWATRHDGTASTDVAEALAVSPDGATVVVTGDHNDPSDYGTVAYDAASGAERWVASYHGGFGIDEAWDVAVGPDGATVFVTGQSRGSDLSDDFATVAYDVATGDQRWVARYSQPGGDDERAYGMALGPNGAHLFVAGSSDAALGEKVMVDYDAATGIQRGIGITQGCAEAIAVSPRGGRVFVTGCYDGGTHNLDFGTVAYGLS